MPDFRYDQFCPLARATEVLGERWTLLIVRELFVGPQRFSDLGRRLPGVSSSVLSSRVRSLEEDGVLVRRQLPPPAASTVFELTELGRALLPVVIAMSAWGLRRLEPPRPGDHYEPSWLRLGLMIIRNPGPSPERRFCLRCPDGDAELVIHVAGGPDGTRVDEPDAAPPPADEVDATLRAEASALLGVLSGSNDLASSIESGAIEVSGNVEAVSDLPALFSIQAALEGRSVAAVPSPVAET